MRKRERESERVRAIVWESEWWRSAMDNDRHNERYKMRMIDYVCD